MTRPTDSTLWPIDRFWSEAPDTTTPAQTRNTDADFWRGLDHAGDRPPSDTPQLRTTDLSRFRAVVMLGAAGSGKTTEAARLADHERASGTPVVECRLAEFADTKTELDHHLARLSNDAPDGAAFYLDALDEAMVPARRCWLAIKHWLERDLDPTEALLRITCRSAVWPEALTATIREFAGDESAAVVFLQPLSDEDVLAAAASDGIDPPAFLDRVERSASRSLAGQPLSLQLLLKLQSSPQGLPASRNELFERALYLLASDPPDRHAFAAANPLSPEQLLHAAERLACYLLLSGRDTVHLDDAPSSKQLRLQELSGKLTRDVLTSLGSSGICHSTSPHTIRFTHRQYAEYLAARRLAKMPPHQTRALLASTAGWMRGIAGPLREVAAFTAISNQEIADWVATSDPEVIGLSDVSDPALRRRATHGLFERFRRGETTLHQLPPDLVERDGLRYNGAQNDLRPIITGRGDGSLHLLAFAIRLVGHWELASLSHDLADLALDTHSELPIRLAACRALRLCGSATARARLRPLIANASEDAEDELKGLALQCNWPDLISTPDLLAALTPPRKPSLYGAYASFLSILDDAGFAAFDHPALGLRWATRNACPRSSIIAVRRLATRIAHAALERLDVPAVARQLTTLMRRWAKHSASPLAGLPDDSLEYTTRLAELKPRAPLHSHSEARRRLIDVLVKLDCHELRELGHDTPGFFNDGDFLWLLHRAGDRRRRLTARQNYLYLARELSWRDDPNNVDAWLRVCDEEPVRSILGNQKSVDLASDHARWLRHDFALSRRAPADDAVSPEPPTQERVLRALRLDRASVRDFFSNLCTVLADEDKLPAPYLTETPGWQQADEATRAEIIDVARIYLLDAEVCTTIARDASPESYSIDVMRAMWLLLDQDFDWLQSRSASWWEGWCWFLLCGLGNAPGESGGRLLRLCNQHAPSTVCRELLALARGPDDSTWDALPRLLHLLLQEPNSTLDSGLCEQLEAGAISERRVAAVSAFVLARAPTTATPLCVKMLNRFAADEADQRGVGVAVSLLQKRPEEAWEALRAFLRASDKRARVVLGRYAHENEPGLIDSWTTRQLGELTSIMVALFSPETDRKAGGFFVVTPEESARMLRERLVAHLGDLEDADAVSALRDLERRFGNRYPWFRRLRSRAERAWRLADWSPYSVKVVGQIMDAAQRRLIRAEIDVVDGIEYSLQRYDAALKPSGGESPEDLWNTPRGQRPTPKWEEHVSNKLRTIILAYFRDHAVMAGRNVEIFTRSVSREQGGQPSSEVDIRVQVAGLGTTSDVSIVVPIEVKLSCNDVARTAIRGQLVERYMEQLGATHGVYVVVWMDRPRRDDLAKTHRPKWRDLDSARRDLQSEAERLYRERNIVVRTVVVDASLR